jgi:hypothetical protein
MEEVRILWIFSIYVGLQNYAVVLSGVCMCGVGAVIWWTPVTLSPKYWTIFVAKYVIKGFVYLFMYLYIIYLFYAFVKVVFLRNTYIQTVFLDVGSI